VQAQHKGYSDFFKSLNFNQPELSLGFIDANLSHFFIADLLDYLVKLLMKVIITHSN
jgi:hypothetical protein